MALPCSQVARKSLKIYKKGNFMKRFNLAVVVTMLTCMTTISMAHNDESHRHKGGGDIARVDCALTQVGKADFSLEAMTDKKHYQVGDSLVLEVTPSSDAYISVIDQGS